MTGIEPAYSAWECDLMALPQVGGLVLRGVSRVFRVLVASVCVPDGGQTRMQPQSRLTAFSQWHGDFSCSTTKFGQLTRMRLTNSRIGVHDHALIYFAPSSGLLASEFRSASVRRFQSMSVE